MKLKRLKFFYPLSSLIMLLALISGGVACSQDGPHDEVTPRPMPEPTSEHSTQQTFSTPIIKANTSVASNSTKNHIAQNGDTVTVHYRGTLEDDTEFDSSIGRDPLTFQLGSGQVILGFENAVLGLSEGETITVTFGPGEAYGEHSEAFVLEFPRDTAPDDIVLGSVLQLTNGLPATVIELNSEIIRIDANHQLAGQTLTFEITLISVR